MALPSIALLTALICSACAARSVDQLRVWFDPQDYTSTFGEPAYLFLWIDGVVDRNVTVKFNAVDGASHVNITAEQSHFYEGASYTEKRTYVSVTGSHQGRFIIKADVEPEGRADDRRLFARLKVALNQPLIYISLVIGWAYTACWSIGYYPQIFLNHQRKSVVGLSFDFLHINIVGHICYAVFNSFMYWNNYIEQEYFDRHPQGLNPVIGNDVGFAVHASLATGYTILQCYFYPKHGNTVSPAAKVIVGTYFVIIAIAASQAVFGAFHWLDFLYILSYIKLSTTLVKYFPQAYMNFKRKSTEGFSIWNRLLDIAGGLLSILQMVINAWNFDDWQSIWGDPVKFGLGVFSILFDIVFIVQHYVLYRKSDHVDHVYKIGKHTSIQTSKL
ncbi:cystinosin homolog isoform X1 [Armigeres subalbatus]|uniref:cystinosin homolog isoform X1 n=1 Tax=Armigeres subalbatus TaxID=124917 RepID=UPI002ED69D67